MCLVVQIMSVNFLISVFSSTGVFWSEASYFAHGFQVSSVRASKSDDKRLSIFTGTKTLHLRCVTKEDRSAWIEALLAAKDLFPKALTNNGSAPSEDIVVSTEKLRLRLAQEGIGEAIIKDCESIMLTEVSELQNQLKDLQQKHLELMDSLRQLEVCGTPCSFPSSTYSLNLLWPCRGLNSCSTVIIILSDTTACSNCHFGWKFEVILNHFVLFSSFAS